jgi:hypothetical protein
MTIVSISEPPASAENARDFDTRSGNRLERAIFNWRLLIVLLCLLTTAVLGWQAAGLRIQASFEKMIPQTHPYVRNFMENAASLRGLGNSVRVVVENKQGDIYDPAYLKTLQTVSDRIFLMPGVDRAFMKSLWTPTVRWTQITEEGFIGGQVMPANYDGSPAAEQALRRNVAAAGLVGTLVAADQKSSMVFVPLLERSGPGGEPLDYAKFSNLLEERVRSLGSDRIDVHIIGFAKLAGDLIDGLLRVAAYFGVAALVAAVLIYLYSRCLRSTALVLSCSLVAVVWQLGIVRLLGHSLDPYSMLVPFLVFAIGVSHGAQKMNGIMQDVGRGVDKYVAARYTFRRLFVAGLTALLADAVGFAVLMMIDIPAIRDLAMTASIGVAVLIFTNLILLPVLLSYVGVSAAAAKRSLSDEERDSSEQARGRGVLAFLERFTERSWATAAVVFALVFGIIGFAVSLRLQIGDLDPGAPELRATSRYNLDNAFITKNFGLSSDQFAVIVRTPPAGINTFQTLLEMDRLEQKLATVPGVQGTMSAAKVGRLFTSGNNEGNPKWMTLNRDPAVVSDAVNIVSTATPDLLDSDRAISPVIAYLRDHKAVTLKAVAQVAEEFANEHSSDERRFLLAAGTSGIEAATNSVVEKASRQMLFLVYGAVALLCLVTFRSWRAVLVAIIPLMLTTILCEALMVVLGIGVKVATLPVIALGVGIGVDYALYLLSVQLACQRAGQPLKTAYRNAVRFTGRVVALIGVTLAAGVLTWAWSPIKFQADMGILLTFMFLWNMVGALVLIPALSHWLLRQPEIRRGKDTSGVIRIPAAAH